MPEPRRRRTAFAATVLRTERLSASLVRLVVGGPGLEGFTPSECTDSYVKVLFVHPDVPRPLLRTEDGRVDVDGIRDAGPAEQAPRTRSYTVRAYDAAARELTLDFVVHGDEGLAGPWAAAARPGDEIPFMGPGGGYAPGPGRRVAPARRRRQRPAGDRRRARAAAAGRPWATPSSRCTTPPTRSRWPVPPASR